MVACAFSGNIFIDAMRGVSLAARIVLARFGVCVRLHLAFTSMTSEFGVYALGYQDNAKARLAAQHMLIRIGRFRQRKGLYHWAYIRLHTEFHRVFGVRRSA